MLLFQIEGDTVSSEEKEKEKEEKDDELMMDGEGVDISGLVGIDGKEGSKVRTDYRDATKALIGAYVRTELISNTDVLSNLLLTVHCLLRRRGVRDSDSYIAGSRCKGTRRSLRLHRHCGERCRHRESRSRRRGAIVKTVATELTKLDLY